MTDPEAAPSSGDVLRFPVREADHYSGDLWIEMTVSGGDYGYHTRTLCWDAWGRYGEVRLSFDREEAGRLHSALAEVLAIPEPWPPDMPPRP